MRHHYFAWHTDIFALPSKIRGWQMKCFNHPYRDAVAVCRSCGRALCPQCTVPAENDRISCANQCEADVIASGSYRTIPRVKKRYPWKILTLLFLTGASFIIGLLDKHFHWTEYSKIWFALPIAVLCISFQFAVGILGEKWKEKIRMKKLKKEKENKR